MAETVDAQTQPFFLKKAKLKDYKSIKDAEIEFCDGLNIIIGKNASGKSNLLEILFKTLDQTNHFANSVELTLQGEEELRINSNLISNDQSELNNYLGKRIKQTEFNFFYKDKKLENNIVLTMPSLIEYNIPNPENYAIINSPLSFKYYSNKKYVDLDKHMKLSLSKFQFLLIILLFQLTPSQEVDLNEDLNFDVFKNKFFLNFEKEISSLNKLFAGLVPIEEIRFNPYINIHFEKESGIFTYSNLFIEYKINGSWLPYSSLSDGTKRLFYIVSEIYAGSLSKYIYRNETFKSIFLFEEPELGIHPHQLHQLMTFIKEQSRDKQIILSTHSPMVLDILGKDELHRIIIASNDDPKKGSQFRHLTEQEKEKAKLYMDGDYLSDYWKYSDLEK